MHTHASMPCCTIAGMGKARLQRRWHRHGACPPACTLLALLSLSGLLLGRSLLAAPAPRAPRPVDPVPVLRIPVEPLGFVAPGHFFMPYRIPSVTLDFLDAEHLLFTFHVANLMHRDADDPKDDQDQSIRALVINLPSGKVSSTGTWRLHDRGRYLWVLDDGHFLMRQRNTLYIGDKTLSLKDYLHPEGTLATVQLSPDAGTIVAQFSKPAKETEESADSNNTADAAPTLGDDAPRLPEHPKQYTILLIDTHKRTANRVGRLSHAVILPLIEGGYVGVHAGKGKLWDVTIDDFNGESRTVASVPSTCQPSVLPISQTVFLAESCLPFSSDQLVDAFDVAGHKLWEQTWQSRFVWGVPAYSLSGDRFAFGSIEVGHSIAALDPISETDILGQPVGVFNVHTGRLDTVLDANPILTAGDNYALSPDGTRLAILRAGAIELYDLGSSGAPSQAAAQPPANLPRHP